MLVKNQMIKVKVIGKTLKHYQNLGYDAKCLQEIYVKAEHLSNGSHEEVEYQCDYCKRFFHREYKTYIHCRKKNNMDSCEECAHKFKAKETCLERYGVSNPMYLEETKEKIRNTNIDKYGTPNSSSNPLVKEKVKNTLLKKYGTTSLPSVPEIKEKMKNTCLNKYGVEHAGSAPEIIKKRTETLNKNSTQKCSKQQQAIYDMLKEQYSNIELNFSFSTLSLDIALFDDNKKIDIEYDGWYWHQDKNRDRRRDEYLKSQGWKILRIKSGHKIPTLAELKQCINKLLNGYKYTEIILNDWKEESA